LSSCQPFDPTTKKRVEVELAAKLKNPKLNDTWERVSKRKIDALDSEGQDVVYSVTTHIVSSAVEISRNSVLLDSAATIHVFNDIFLFYRFQVRL
jgi:hypothetical protein